MSNRIIIIQRVTSPHDNESTSSASSKSVVFKMFYRSANDHQCKFGAFRGVLSSDSCSGCDMSALAEKDPSTSGPLIYMYITRSYRFAVIILTITNWYLQYYTEWWFNVGASSAWTLPFKLNLNYERFSKSSTLLILQWINHVRFLITVARFNVWRGLPC